MSESIIKKMRTVIAVLLSVCLIFLCASCTAKNEPEITKPSTVTQSQTVTQTQPVPPPPIVIGIAWRDDITSEAYTSTVKTIEAAGGKSVLLPQVKSADLTYDENGRLTNGVNKNGTLTNSAGKLIRCNRYQKSNAADALAKVSAVVFTGGEDISPSLYYTPQPWHGIKAECNYDAERDVSDFLLMEYCLDNDIPILCICRGMQMLSVVSGAEMIQDLPTYFAEKGKEYNYQHRNQKAAPGYSRDYAPHDVSVVKDSMLYEITGAETLSGCPSWHHQAVLNVKNTRLKVTGTHNTNGIKIIEAVERTDKTFALGLQFHPEAAVAKHLQNAANANSYMNYDDAISFFKYLIKKASSDTRTAA